MHDLWRAGHEIAAHTITHDTHYNTSEERIKDEVNGCRLTISNFASIPEREIRGFRAPFLEYSQRSMEAIRKAGFEYDCSVTEYGKQVCEAFTKLS